MLNPEIKQEIDDNFESQCLACLSLGRRLTPIGIYKDLYYKLTARCIYGIGSSAKDVHLCWECISLLKKVTQFQQQVQKANEMLQNGQNYIYGTLSSLTTVIFNDANPNIIYVNESSILEDIYKPNADVNDESSDSISNDNDMVINNEEMDSKIDVKSELINQKQEKEKEENSEKKPVRNKIKYKNKWAEKRALQNKLPKFKVITKDLNLDKYFRRVQIDVEKVKKYMERERDRYRFSKSRFKCESCVVVFRSEKLLMRHKDAYHNKEKGEYICDICKKVVSKKRCLLRHINKHTVRFNCIICGYSCRSKERSSHMTNKHKKVIQCLQCELLFGCRQKFSKHYKDWHEKFICDHCGVSFKMRYCIEDHIKKQHSPFECAPCNKRFSRYNGLWFHNKVCHSQPRPEGAPVQAYCVECDKRFPDTYRYKWHLRNSVKHTPKKKVRSDSEYASSVEDATPVEVLPPPPSKNRAKASTSSTPAPKPRKRKPTIAPVANVEALTRIPCPDCDKVFTKNIYMKDHYNLVHLKNFKYRCEECNKNFVRNADLVKHKRRVHEGVLPPRNKICYVCGRGFTTNEILTQHLRTHSGERPHGCACGAAFAQRAALRAHARAPHHAHVSAELRKPA